jgi:hypothetical protein
VITSEERDELIGRLEDQFLFAKATGRRKDQTQIKSLIAALQRKHFPICDVGRYQGVDPTDPDAKLGPCSCNPPVPPAPCAHTELLREACEAIATLRVAFKETPCAIEKRIVRALSPAAPCGGEWELLETYLAPYAGMMRHYEAPYADKCLAVRALEPGDRVLVYRRTGQTGGAK